MAKQFWALVGWACLAALIWLLVGPMEPAIASLRTLEEAPGQVVYQSRQTLKDQQGGTWQGIAFKRTSPQGKGHLYLRLAGFPGTVEIDRSWPLVLIDSLGQTLSAVDASSDLFAEAASPEPNIGQYDLQPLVQQLRPELPLQLNLVTIKGVVILPAPPNWVREWQLLDDAP